ncbi:hypothetical protein V8F33_013418 [Rhypophila sp. PSN 637]
MRMAKHSIVSLSLISKALRLMALPTAESIYPHASFRTPDRPCHKIQQDPSSVASPCLRTSDHGDNKLPCPICRNG